MKRIILALVAFAMVGFAGFAIASPDTAAAMLASLVDPHAAGLMLAWGPVARNLEAKKAEAVQSMTALLTKAEAEDRDFTAEEAAQFDKLKADKAALDVRIQRAQDVELAEAGMQRQAPANAAAPVAAEPRPGVGTAVAITAASSISVGENFMLDANRGFRNFGEYAQQVRVAGMANRTGAQIDHRIQGIQAAAPSTFAGEGSGSDGGILVPPGFSTNIFTLSLMEDALLPLTDQMPVEGNNMMIPKDETTPWGTNGVRAFWQGEATAGTATKPVLTGLDLRLKKLLALVPVSDELLADGTALTAYLPGKVAVSMRWKTNEAILFGTGAGTPLGALNGAAAVVQAKDSGQATLTLSALNLANMISRLPPGSYPRAIWLINNNVLPALFTMTLGNYPIYLPGGAPVAGGIQANPYGMLLGRPIVISQHAKSFSAQGDVILCDFSYYQAITKSEGMQTATSMHLYFDADAMAFRTTFRLDGMPKLSAPISPANGSTTLSPFVQLAAR